MRPRRLLYDVDMAENAPSSKRLATTWDDVLGPLKRLKSKAAMPCPVAPSSPLVVVPPLVPSESDTTTAAELDKWKEDLNVDRGVSRYYFFFLESQHVSLPK